MRSQDEQHQPIEDTTYQNVRQPLREQLEPLALNAESRVAIYGTGEFAELAYLGLKEIGIEEIDVFGTKYPIGRRFLRMPVQDVTMLRPEHCDRIVVALLEASGRSLAGLQELGPPPEKVVTFSPDGPTMEQW